MAKKNAMFEFFAIAVVFLKVRSPLFSLSLFFFPLFFNFTKSFGCYGKNGVGENAFVILYIEEGLGMITSSGSLEPSDGCHVRSSVSMIDALDVLMGWAQLVQLCRDMGLVVWTFRFPRERLRALTKQKCDHTFTR